MLVPWTIQTMQAPPRVEPAPAPAVQNIQSLFYEGLPWRGRATKVFAYFRSPNNGVARHPAVILVHGGGGTAFDEWVRLWNERGYAAIAIDTCGCTAGGCHGDRPRHAHGGPPGWSGCDQVDQPIEDQWPYHAVADIVLAHSLLRSMDQIDPDRIGLVGLSWGAWLSCIAAGVDERLRFIISIYGCSVRADEGIFPAELAPLPQEKAARWRELWDPSRFLARARMPILWLSGPDDFAFALSALQRSYRLPPGPRTLSIQVGMQHGHEYGWAPRESDAFADSVVRDGVALPRFTEQQADQRRLRARFAASSLVIGGYLAYTADRGPWEQRKWRTAPARVTGDRIEGVAPTEASAAYLNVVDDRQLVVSTEHVTYGS